MGSARSRLRLDEARSDAQQLRSEYCAWRTQWDSSPLAPSHLTHLKTLDGVIGGLIDDVDKRLQAAEPLAVAATAGEMYEACRAVDVSLLYTRRLWRYYGDKLDQRLQKDDAQLPLKAADEVVWSTWKGLLTAVGLPVPPAPLPYIAPLESASAAPPEAFPSDLRTGDERLKQLCDAMPIPVIAFGPSCRVRPWWLVLIAHETGHHIQFSRRIQAATADAFRAAVLAEGGDSECADRWASWSKECFADAISVAAVGAAALWSIAELEERTDARLGEAKGAYPPPSQRLALLAAVAAKLGIPRPEWLETAAQHALEVSTPPGSPPSNLIDGLADAVLGLDLGAGKSIATLRQLTAAQFAVAGPADRWRNAFLAPDDPSPTHEIESARLCIAGGVGAAATADATVRETIARRLVTVLPRCGPTATRAVDPMAEPDVTRALDSVQAALNAFGDSA